jgi:OFA family oxalate/formate antiporter-like MFS transporter
MKNRWSQLALGVVCMMAISSPQYVWALFTKPLTAALGVSLPALQVTFSLLVLLQAFLSPFQGFLIEKFGTRTLLASGAALTGLSWILSAYAVNAGELYLAYGVLGGVGTGIIYVGVIGHMVQWFPDRRGLATGLAAAGYGSGAILTTIPISHIIASSNYRHALLEFGIILGAIGILAALGLRKPDAAALAGLRTQVKTSTNLESARDYTPLEMVKTPLFWVLFAMMTMMCTSGLMVISQMGAFTKDFGMGDVLVFGVAALPLALSIDRITNGFTRPFFGWVSDRIGRETTMVVAFSLEGLAMIAWLFTRNDPTVFVLMSGVVFFGWGEIFSLFPATLTDTFGTRHATTNYGVLYIAFGVGSVLGGPVAALLHDATHSWIPVFEAIIVMNFLTALLAHVVLRPARRRWLAQPAAMDEIGETHTAPALAQA